LYRSATTHSKKPNRRNFRAWNSHGQCGYMTGRGIFGGSVLQLYRIGRRQCDRPSKRQLRFLSTSGCSSSLIVLSRWCRIVVVVYAGRSVHLTVSRSKPCHCHLDLPVTVKWLSASPAVSAAVALAVRLWWSLVRRWINRQPR